MLSALDRDIMEDIIRNMIKYQICQHSIERYNGTGWEEVGQTLGFRSMTIKKSRTQKVKSREGYKSAE